MEADKLSCIIAEDHAELASMLEQLAKNEELEVVATVNSGLCLVECVRENRPDLLLVDITLERLDGLSACRQLLDEGFSPQLIIVTGSISSYDLLAGIKLGTIDYLHKPVDPGDFSAAIRKARLRIQEAKLANMVRRNSDRLIRITKNYRDIELKEQDVVFVEKTDKRVFEIHMADGSIHESSTNLDKIKRQCSDAIFFPHKSFLVNFHYIRSVLPNLAVEGNYDILLAHHPDIVPLTRRHYREYVKLKLQLQAGK
ncbi:LytR/AlgR family response regulator transcription factor [Paenibacillus chartarius]|uniref:LytR/AlgR family response regulator transcription factor n=1 Tax=Paenibacillus chartarius TaxID=747481 RepID=A0ABV6DTA6_9BACL